MKASRPLTALRELVERELGIRMPEEKASLLGCRLQRRLRALGLDSLDEYREHLHANAHAELPEFIDAVTTNKTDFYREPLHFEYLRTTALPALTRAPRSRVLKAWCAGCSSGEEPYTMAMALGDYLRAKPGMDYRILATDISTRVLEHAKLAIYQEAQLEPLPLTWRERYVAKGKDKARQQVRIRPEVRQRVTFHRLNFMAPDYNVRERFSMIFFRNVAIYFDRETQLEVIGKLAAHLEPGGYFMIGLSESLKTTVPGLERVGPSIYVRTG